MPATLDLRRGQVVGNTDRHWATSHIDAAIAVAPNKAITLSGDISGSGTAAITTTLPTVNANVGTFQGLTVNAKGQVTAASNQAYATTVQLSGYLALTGGTLTGQLVSQWAAPGGNVVNQIVNSGTGGTAGTEAGLEVVLSSIANAYGLVDILGGASPQMRLVSGTGAIGGLAMTTGAGHISMMPSGNVGIGTTTPGHKVDVFGDIFVSVPTNPSTIATATQLLVGEASHTPGYAMALGYVTLPQWCGVIQALDHGSAAPLLLNANGGNVGIGVLTPGVAGTPFANARLSVDGNITLRGAAGGDSWANQRLIWGGDGTGYALSFASQDNAGVLHSPVMTLLDSGNVGIGTTAPSKRLSVNAPAAADFVADFNNTNAAAGDNVIRIAGGAAGSDTTTALLAFYNSAISAWIGGIQRNGASTVAFLTTSDERLKEGIAATKTGLDALMKIKVRDYSYKDDERVEQGILAQELHAIYPIAVHPGGDDPGMQPWMMDYGRLTPLLIRAVQEQQELIVSLEERLAALEGTR